MACCGLVNLPLGIEVESFGGQNAVVVQVRDNKHVVTFKYVLDVKLEVRLTLQSCSPVVPKFLFSLYLALANEWNCLLGAKHDVIAIVTDDDLEIMAIPSLLPRHRKRSSIHKYHRK